MREGDPKLAKWADEDSDDDVPDMSKKNQASSESCRRTEVCADGWPEGLDKLWRKRFDKAAWMPTCGVGNVTHTVVRDCSSGVPAWLGRRDQCPKEGCSQGFPQAAGRGCNC